MKIRWYGHASFLIIASDGTKIITDPYEPGGYGGAISYGKIPDAPEMVLVSHQHEDHNYVKGVPGKPEIISDKGEREAKGIKFKGIPSYHDASRGKERGENIIFCFTLDGMRICHLGDLGHRLGKEEMTQIGEVDLLLIPVGGTYTLDPKGATEVWEDLKPKITIPMHFKTPKCGFPLAPVEEFLKGKDRVRQLGESEVEIKKEKLPSLPEIIVLSHAL